MASLSSFLNKSAAANLLRQSKPQSYMFKEMRSPAHLHIRLPLLNRYRKVLSISSKTDILEHIYSLPAEHQPEAMGAIREIESTAMTLQEPQPGLEKLMGYLETRGVRRALCTRNFESVVSPFHSPSLSPPFHTPESLYVDIEAILPPVYLPQPAWISKKKFIPAIQFCALAGFSISIHKSLTHLTLAFTCTLPNPNPKLYPF